MRSGVSCPCQDEHGHERGVEVPSEPMPLKNKASRKWRVEGRVPEIKGGECEQKGKHWRQAIQATCEVLMLLIPITRGCTAPGVPMGAARTPTVTESSVQRP